jgi:tetraacyldisaccharide 4'-kinase
LDQQTYRRLISGQVCPLIGIPVGLLLTVLSWPYCLVVRVRNALYDRGLVGVHRVDIPVLCVGNLTTGGTGKTPLVAWLARMLGDREKRVAILTRGYKTRKGILSDEPAELVAGCPGTSVIVNADRVAGANEAIRSHGAQVVLMDDGFQHRRLGHDLDIIAVDATLPFGYGRLLPAGLLREPATGLKRAHAVVITRSDQVGPDRLDEIERQIRQIHPDVLVARAVHAPAGARGTDGSEIGLEALRAKRIFAFCGLGNPAGFFRTAEACGSALVGSEAFNDHHTYTERCLSGVYDKARSQGADLVLTTSKDWSKVAPLVGSEGALATAYLAVELRFTDGEESLTTLIERTLGGRMVAS